jgi:hypothetical protein
LIKRRIGKLWLILKGNFHLTGFLSTTQKVHCKEQLEDITINGVKSKNLRYLNGASILTVLFHSNPLMWNEKPLKLILDHKNGNHSDNRTKILQLLCPNCNSQLKPHGGGNKGKVRMAEGEFGILSDDGKWNYVLPTEIGHYSTTEKGTKHKKSKH